MKSLDNVEIEMHYRRISSEAYWLYIKQLWKVVILWLKFLEVFFFSGYVYFKVKKFSS